MKRTKSRPNTYDSREGATYLADLEIRRSMELQGAVEVVLNLRADLELCLPDGFLLLLAAEKFQGDPGLDNRPMTGPLGRPHAKYLLGGRHELGNPVGCAGRSSRVDVPRISGSCTTGTTFFGAVRAVAAVAASPSSPALAVSAATAQTAPENVVPFMELPQSS